VGVETLLNQQKDDHYWMRQALELAQEAARCDEVPVGAVLVNKAGELLARGYNRPISASDPTAHAEIVVIREAATRLQNYRLIDTTLYVTLEPCVMCVGALVQARVGRIVYGALEPKTGAIQSAHQLFDSAQFNHTPEISSGVLETECSNLISQFFQQKRAAKIR
jgi:tRNA(adenine34) deaminase